MFITYCKRLRKVLVIFVIAGMIVSCRSNKDLTFLKDVALQGAIKGSPKYPSDYQIKKRDNLYVSIVSSNAEMNELFNPAFAGTGQATARNISYQDPAGQYINGYQVNVEGDLVLPLIGTVEAEGLTIEQCEDAIRKKASEYLKEITVRVRLLNYKVTVIGEVASPGVYYNYNYDFTVWDAISFANGITDFADLEKVVVLRTFPEGSYTFHLDLSSKEALQSAGYYLQPNDVVFVRPAKYKNVRLRTPVYTVALSTVATVLLFLNFLK